eukprot:30231_3
MRSALNFSTGVSSTASPFLMSLAYSRMTSKSDVWVTVSGLIPRESRSVKILSTNSSFSLEGFVSSKRRMSFPLKWRASFRKAAFACPMWRKPLGSGGNRVTTLPSVAPGRSMSKEPPSFFSSVLE